MKTVIRTTINDQPHELLVDPRETLIEVVRERVRLTGAHIGCRTASCGACTLSLDGQTVKACCVPAGDAEGRSIRTIEDTAAPQELDDIQTAFAEVQGMQCGFCTPGMIMSVRQLFLENPSPTDQEIRIGIAGNLCRCTGYVNIIRAIRRVRDERAQSSTGAPEGTAAGG